MHCHGAHSSIVPTHKQEVPYPTSFGSSTVCLRNYLPSSKAAKPHSRYLLYEGRRIRPVTLVLALTGKNWAHLHSSPRLSNNTHKYLFTPSLCVSYEVHQQKPWCSHYYLELHYNTPLSLPASLLHPSFLPSIYLPDKLYASWASNTQSTGRAGTRLCHSQATALTLGLCDSAVGVCCLPWFQSTIYSQHPHGCRRIKTWLSRERKTVAFMGLKVVAFPYLEVYSF